MKYICEHCRNQVTDSQKFCGNCGSLFDQELDSEDKEYYKNAVDHWGIDVNPRTRDVRSVKEVLARIWHSVKVRGKNESFPAIWLGVVLGSLRNGVDGMDKFLDNSNISSDSKIVRALDGLVRDLEGDDVVKKYEYEPMYKYEEKINEIINNKFQKI